MFESTRADGNAVGEVTPESIIAEPIVAECPRPFTSVNAFPLGSEVPAQWNGFGPKEAKNWLFIRNFRSINASIYNLRTDAKSGKLLGVV